MAKPRVIIADTDINYIIPLQLKFVKDFFDQIDLEIITDESYFDELFNKPQKAEILIVSDEMYDSSLQKHNISNIFVMMEQDEESETAELNIVRLFKYTSIKEIFNEIVSKSVDALNIEDQQKKETQIIVVTSAVGGTGKTTVAMGISACLTKNYKKVLYINTDELQTFQYMLNNQTPITNSEVYARLMNVEKNTYEEIKHIFRNESFCYMPPLRAAMMSLNIKKGNIAKLVMSAKESRDFDYIVVDTDSAFDEEKAEMLNMADKVLIITKQSKEAVFATNILISNINGADSDKYIFICNDFMKDSYNAMISPDAVLKFSVSEYIDHLESHKTMSCEELHKNTSIQKATFLIV